MSKLCEKYEFEPFFVVMLKVHPVDPCINKHLLKDRKIPVQVSGRMQSRVMPGSSGLQAMEPMHL